MALRFYFGDAGAGKSHAVFTRIIEESMREPGTRFLVLVPEQSTMETQRRIVEMHPRRGIMNIDVLSMTRLAYRVFAEVGYRKEEMLEEIGKTFLLKKVALEHKSRLSWFGTLIDRPEYLAEMKATMSELMLYGVSPEDLEGSAAGEGPLAEKMKDLTLLYREFRKRLEGSYMTAEEVPERLSRLVEKSGLIRDAVLVLDGFTGFTPLQLVLIRRLLPLVREMYVTVTAGAGENPFAPCREDNLFAMSHETVRALALEAKQAGALIAEPVYVTAGPESRHGTSGRLRFLEEHLFRGKADKMYIPDAGGKEQESAKWESAKEESAKEESVKGKSAKGDSAKKSSADIRILAAPSPREEILAVSREICRMVREEGYRYRDFAIVTGDLTTYGNCVRRIFSQAEIPFFIDEKRALIRNPFMEYLRAALEAVTENYGYEPVFRMLKSGMADMDRNGIDHLENYVIATGIRGKGKWREPFIRHYRGQDEGELPALNRLREEVCALLNPLSDGLAARGGTVREKTAALYEFCVRSRAEEKLREKEQYFRETGRTDLAAEYAQVWPYIVSFLDKLAQVLGDERISMKDYRALVEAGFGEARVAIIPPGHDQVAVGDMERSRLAGIRVLFFVGVNEGLIPKPPASGGTFTEADRTALAVSGIRLKPTARAQIYIDRFYLYLTLTRPSEKLILSYAAAGISGEILRPAYLIGLIGRMFPDLAAESSPESLPDRIEREKTGISLLLPGLSSLDTEVLPPSYLELFSYYSHHGLYRRRVEMLLQAAGVRKEADRISKAAAAALYGETLRNSASRLELFCSCRYAHFLSYGLKLKPRQEYAFTGLDMGSILHRSLELFSHMAEDAGRTWASLAGDEETLGRFSSACVRKAVEEYGSTLFTDSARDRYRIGRMERLMRETARTQAEQLAAGDFSPAGAEIAFRSLAELDSFHIELSDGARMQLTGRIDRLDTYEEGDRVYVKITDYKTGGVTFDLTEVYYGLQMQLILYLNAAMELLRQQGKHPVPAGIFYYRIQDPVVEYQPLESDEELRHRRMKEMKASGTALRDPETARHFDRNLRPGSTSDVLPAGLKQDGSFTAKSALLDEAAFYTLGRHVEKVAREAAKEILEGSAEIDPYSYRQETACDFCPYRAVCGFDRRIRGYRLRELLPMKQEEVLEKMEEYSGGSKLD